MVSSFLFNFLNTNCHIQSVGMKLGIEEYLSRISFIALRETNQPARIYFSPDPKLHIIRPLEKSTVRPTPRQGLPSGSGGPEKNRTEGNKKMLTCLLLSEFTNEVLRKTHTTCNLFSWYNNYRIIITKLKGIIS